MSSTGRAEPRRFLIDPGAFGLERNAGWHPERDPTERVERVAAYIQHRAICVLREKYLVRPVEELARAITTGGYRTKVNETYLRRQLTGEYAVPFTELLTWALALNDPTILPAADSINDLLPPVGETDDW